MSAPRRNVELKASDPDPAGSLGVCHALGADDHGLLHQRDTYFRVASGRLKLREQSPGGATLIQYGRADAALPRESRYRLVPIPDADELRAALDASLGTLAVVEKQRHLLLWSGVRIHLDRVTGLGSFVELEAVAEPGSDLTAEHEKVAQLSAALAIAPEQILRGSYADLLLGADATPTVTATPAATSTAVVVTADALIAAARAALQHAYAPYSRLRVGAALRADDGSIHAGANVENAAYPQSQCAEASALGALVTAGGTRVVEAAVIADSDALCVPCGGCRQRLLELMAPDATIHLCSLAGAHETTTLAQLLPRAFGAEALPA